MTEIDEAVAIATGGSPARSGDGADPSTKSTRRGRVRKWDRPAPPHDWRWWAGGVGRVLMAIGLLMFGFVAYQLWGTGIETARAQRALESDFEAQLAAAPPIDPGLAIVTPTEPASDVADAPADDEPQPSDEADETDDVTEPADGPSPTAVVPVAAQNIPEIENGEAIARIEIPAIGVDDIVVAGINIGDLKKGPGHFPQTPLPGQLGNAAIAGHRTTYGQPFFNVDKLAPGDQIIVTTLSGEFVYRVTGQQIVAPSAGHVVATTDPSIATLTLTSCHPKWSARQRIVISSELDTGASSIVGEPVINYGHPPEVSGSTPSADPEPDGTLPAGADGEPAGSDSIAEPATGSTPSDQLLALQSAAATAEVADAFAEGWFSDPTANPHVLFWGLLLALIGVGSYLLSRRFRRDWLGAMVGLLPFIVTLYFFFQNVNRLLPPNL